MATDDLIQPVAGASRKRNQSRAWRLPSLASFLFGTLGIFVLGVTGFIMLVKDPMGGEPHIISSIVRVDPDTSTAMTSSSQSTGTGTTTSPTHPRGGTSTASELEQEAGVSVVRGTGEAAPNSVVIHLSDPVSNKLSPAPDRRISERTRYGLLPKIGADGARAMSVYARPSNNLLAGGQVPVGRIAIAVGGLGISASVTGDAIRKLPAPITLAFAPYGSDLERLVAQAREDGHEVMLQIPMEPFDYPDSDPGPHTLTVSAKPQDNIDKLHWVLGRFAGYVGVINFMGAKITAETAALQPILKELGQRGLIFVDDGSSARSVAVTTAKDQQTPALKADVVIDAVARSESIDKELARLEGLAREKGFALGSASALPVTLERLASWSATLEAKGILLLPVSAAFSSAGGTTSSLKQR